LILKGDIPALFKYRLTPTVCDMELARAINDKARSKKKIINLHIKVDTGMGRIGILHQDAEQLIKKVYKLPFVKIEGVFTHFPFADLNRDFTLYQMYLFARLLHNLHKHGINFPLVHAANSMGVIDYKKSHFSMVRPGLIIYGLYPRDNLKIKLKPLLSLKTRVVFIKNLPKGYGISYGHIYTTKKNTKIVTLPIGYGDGYPRNLSNLAPVLIGGRRFKVSGRICMDQMMVDVGEAPVKIGDEVVLIGSQGRNKISVEELATLSETIPYEIVCGLGSRIPRIYI
jgi:alanine racemase